MFIVCKEQKQLLATKRHESFVFAQLEAERLCRETGQEFMVFALVGTVKPKQVPVEWQMEKRTEAA